MKRMQSKSWSVDHAYDNHTYDDFTDNQVNEISAICESSKPVTAELFETEQQKKKRKRSHFVAYLTMFVMTIGFSIVITGVWPYLQLLDPSLTKTSLGWVIAANPMGQLIASPIVGYIGNRLGSIRLVCYFTMTLFIVGNILYSFLPAMDDLWEHSAYHIMIIARFITGLSASNVTLCRSYIASSTTVKERTTAISIISAAQALGFVIGPATQAILSLAIDKELLKYRSCGWVGAVLGFVNFILLMPFIFKEYNIAERERALLKAQQGVDEDFQIPKINFGAIFVILFGFFINQFNYVLLESLLEPYVTDQFSWCDELAVVVVGGTLAFVGLLALPMFFTATRLAKRMDERKILMFCGFVPISIGIFLMLPWGPGTLTYCNDTSIDPEPIYENNLDLGLDVLKLEFQHNYIDSINIEKNDNSSDKFCDSNTCWGCPPDQVWCIDYPAIPKAQFFSGFVIVCAGYPFGVSMSNAIFSKMLGPKPQGLWMGILTASGSLARVTGPIFVSYTYTNLGSRILFLILLGLMFIAFFVILIFYKKLVPMKIPELLTNRV